MAGPAMKNVVLRPYSVRIDRRRKLALYARHDVPPPDDLPLDPADVRR